MNYKLINSGIPIQIDWIEELSELSDFQVSLHNTIQVLASTATQSNVDHDRALLAIDTVNEISKAVHKRLEFERISQEETPRKLKKA